MQFLSPRAHTIIGLILGIVLLLAPILFGFSGFSGPATAIPRLLGITVIISELLMRNGISPVGLVPETVHIAVEVVLGAFLSLSPWIFGFVNQGINAWLPHVVAGLVLMGYASVTRTNENEIAFPVR